LHSDDDGKTWKLKRLPADILTVGYVTATQGPDGVIHIATSKNSVNYEIELNEAWVLAPDAAKSPEADAKPLQDLIGPVMKHTEKWPNGKLKVEWGNAHVSDGRTLLEGPQTFCFENGTRQWTAEFHLGRKIGNDVFYRADGSKEWQKTYGADGHWTWRLFDAAGKQTAESHWRGKTLIDAAFTEAK
jgi:hypothetical protein